MRELTDEELVRAIQEGDVFAFEVLVKRYQHKLHSFVFHMIRDEQPTQDVVQESFINLYKTIDRVDTSKKFSSYVFSIARNTTISYIRKYKKEVPLEEILLSAEEESLYEGLVRAEQSHTIAKALATLSAQYKEVIRLYYFEDLSYEEISKAIHVPVNTVRTHMRRAKDMLKKVLSHEKN